MQEAWVATNGVLRGKDENAPSFLHKRISKHGSSGCNFVSPGMRTHACMLRFANPVGGGITQAWGTWTPGVSQAWSHLNR